MEDKKILFLVKTRSFRAYIVASDSNTAWNKFQDWFKNTGSGSYGTSDDRLLESIEVIATQEAYNPLPADGRNCLQNGDDMLIL